MVAEASPEYVPRLDRPLGASVDKLRFGVSVSQDSATSTSSPSPTCCVVPSSCWTAAGLNQKLPLSLDYRNSDTPENPGQGAIFIPYFLPKDQYWNARENCINQPLVIAWSRCWCAPAVFG